MSSGSRLPWEERQQWCSCSISPFEGHITRWSVDISPWGKSHVSILRPAIRSLLLCPSDVLYAFLCRSPRPTALASGDEGTETPRITPTTINGAAVRCFPGPLSAAAGSQFSESRWVINTRTHLQSLCQLFWSSAARSCHLLTSHPLSVSVIQMNGQMRRE